MIELKENEKLYVIFNEGCDDETVGLVILTDVEFSKMKEIVENLNKNSTYGCMPTISVFRIDPGMVIETTDIDDGTMYLNDKMYMSATSHRCDLEAKGERVI